MTTINCNRTRFSVAKIIADAQAAAPVSPEEEKKQKAEQKKMNDAQRERKNLLKEKEKLERDREKDKKKERVEQIDRVVDKRLTNVEQQLVEVPIIRNEIMTPEKRSVIIKIRSYAESPVFGGYLDSIFTLSRDTLNIMNTYDLQRLLEDIQFTITNRNIGKQSATLILIGLHQIEKVLAPMLDCKGLTQICLQSPDFMELVEEYRLENMQLTTLSTRNRLIVMALQKCLYARERNLSPPETKEQIKPNPVQQTNTNQPQAPQPNTKKMTPEFQVKYADLLKK